MIKKPASLYTSPLPKLSARLITSIEKGCRAANPNRPIEIFFRADDIAAPARGFRTMISLFQRHCLPLNLAVVPTWLTDVRLSQLRAVTGHDDTLLCWFQHGRVHKNYESSGKKQEFGPSRDYNTALHHIRRGKERLEHVLGESFQPFFTPPWNRCSRDAAMALRDLSFKAISRNSGARPDVSDLLPDIQVNVDLHTRKEKDPTLCLENLLAELENGLASGRCGIMLHHQRMNDNAAVLLDLLLGHLAHSGTSAKLFGDIDL